MLNLSMVKICLVCMIEFGRLPESGLLGLS